MEDKETPLDIRHNPGERRYEAATPRGLAVAEYVLNGNVMFFTHTEVPRELQGHGIASQITRFALDDARARGMRVVPHCSFVAAYMRRHPEYQDLKG